MKKEKEDTEEEIKLKEREKTEKDFQEKSQVTLNDT